MKMTVTSSASKTVSSWSNRDLLIYFSDKMKESYSSSFSIPPVAWQSMMGRMKGFRTKLNLDSERYKNFIDKVFEYFTQESYAPVFGAIVSEKVYHVVNKISSRQAEEKTDWLSLRDLLYDNLLFQKFEKN